MYTSVAKIREALRTEKGTVPVMHAATFAGADGARLYVLESGRNIRPMLAGQITMQDESRVRCVD